MTDSATELEFESESVREEYAEYTTDEGVVAVITDPENRCAWVRSSEIVDVEP